MSYSSSPLLPNGFTPAQIQIIAYDIAYGDKIRKLTRECYAPAHADIFDPRAAADQVLRAQREIRGKKKRRRKQFVRASHFPVLSPRKPPGTRLALYRRPDRPATVPPLLVASYGIVLDSQDIAPRLPITGYIDNLLFPKGLGNYSTLSALLFADLENQAENWARAIRGPVALGFYVSRLKFGETILKPLGFRVAAENVPTRAYGEVTFYTRTYGLEPM